MSGVQTRTTSLSTVGSSVVYRIAKFNKKDTLVPSPSPATSSSSSSSSSSSTSHAAPAKPALVSAILHDIPSLHVSRPKRKDKGTKAENKKLKEEREEDKDEVLPIDQFSWSVVNPKLGKTFTGKEFKPDKYRVMLLVVKVDAH